MAARRDRLFRSRFYRLSFERDLKEFGVRLMALNDTGHKIGDGVLDDFAEWEREEIAGRLHEGIRNMIVGGEIKAGPKPPYGYRFDATGKALVVHEPEMLVLRRIFREMAAGTSAGSLARELEVEGTPGPSGISRWNKKTIANFLASDLYRPYAAEEVVGMVAPELAAKLDPERPYALWHWNRRKTKKRKEWDGDRYVTRYSSELRPREQWLTIPVDITDAGLSRATVDRARELAKDRYKKPSRAADRFWQLRGIARCGECGSVLSPHTVTRKRQDGTRVRTPYYQCRRYFNNGRRNCSHTRSYPAAQLEATVWYEILVLLSDPARLRRQAEGYIARRRQEICGDPDREVRTLAERLRKLDRREEGYLDLAADGDMSREKLRAKLAELEEQRKAVRRELEEARRRLRALHEPERVWTWLDRSVLQVDAMRLSHSSMEDRHRIYQALRLQAEVGQDRTVRLNGVFDPEVSLLDEVVKDAPDVLTQRSKAREKLKTVVVSGDTHSRR
jgi:hypothetical protein